MAVEPQSIPKKAKATAKKGEKQKTFLKVEGIFNERRSQGDFLEPRGGVIT